jgi:hypothetical protein
MKKNLVTLFLPILSVALCHGQSTNISEALHRNWGTAVASVQLSVSLKNTVIAAASSFSVFTAMENTSSNFVFVGESSPDQEFSVFLVANSGRTYKLTRTPLGFTRSGVMKINPGTTANWIIAVNCAHYFDPPGFIPTKTAVPAGDYLLKATRKFSVGNKAQEIESNLLSVRIE